MTTDRGADSSREPLTEINDADGPAKTLLRQGMEQQMAKGMSTGGRAYLCVSFHSPTHLGFCARAGQR